MSQARCYPLWALGTHLPTFSSALVQGEIVAGLYRGYVATMASTRQQEERGAGAQGLVLASLLHFPTARSLGWFIWICFLPYLERSLDPTSYLPWSPLSEQRSALCPPPPPSSFCGFGLKAQTLASALLSEFRHLPYLTPCLCLNSPPCSICQGLHLPRTTCLSATQSDKEEAGEHRFRGARGEGGGMQGSGPGKKSAAAPRQRGGRMQIKHSAIREYSDHLITFQSGLPHVSHQSLQDKSRSPSVREAQSHWCQEPWLTPTDLL